MLPSDKSDTDAVRQLQSASRATVAPLVPSLLQWMQDMNWPVARPIAELLRDYPDELVAPVRAVLRGNDDVWKYWVICELLVDGPRQLREAVSEDVLRIVNKPTTGEVAEEVDLTARDVIFVQSYLDE